MSDDEEIPITPPPFIRQTGFISDDQCICTTPCFNPRNTDPFRCIRNIPIETGYHYDIFGRVQCDDQTGVMKDDEEEEEDSEDDRLPPRRSKLNAIKSIKLHRLSWKP